MLSPGGPRSSWIKSGDISQDKERRITCEKFSSVKKENRFVEHLKISLIDFAAISTSHFDFNLLNSCSKPLEH